MSSIKRISGLICAGIVFLFVGPFTGSSLRPQTVVGHVAPASLTPFLLHKREWSFAKGTARPEVTDFTVARRSDGSKARWFVVAGKWSPSGKSGEVGEIWDVPGHKNIIVEPFTQSVSTYRMSDEEVSALLRSEDACGSARASSSGNTTTRTMLGHAVFQITERAADYDIVSWVAPDLNCYPMKAVESFQSSSQNIKIVQETAVGEPPQSMFTAPPDFKERSPSQVEAAYESDYPGHVLFQGRFLQNLEQKYHSAQ